MLYYLIMIPMCRHILGRRLLLLMTALALTAEAQGCLDFGKPMRTGDHSASLAGHRVLLGDAYHRSGYCDPMTNCAACHGDTLRGGPSGEPSCTSCHGGNWDSERCGAGSHTVNLGGHFHDPAYCLPYQNCVECHGATLRGGTGGQPSCLSCHTQTKWMNCGSTNHADNRDGAMHAANPCAPSSSCVLCHGTDLRGGPNGEPSCYGCHEALWTNCGD